MKINMEQSFMVYPYTDGYKTESIHNKTADSVGFSLIVVKFPSVFHM